MVSFAWPSEKCVKSSTLRTSSTGPTSRPSTLSSRCMHRAKQDLNSSSATMHLSGLRLPPRWSSCRGRPKSASRERLPLLSVSKREGCDLERPLSAASRETDLAAPADACRVAFTCVWFSPENLSCGMSARPKFCCPIFIPNRKRSSRPLLSSQSAFSSSLALFSWGLLEAGEGSADCQRQAVDEGKKLSEADRCIDGLGLRTVCGEPLPCDERKGDLP